MVDINIYQIADSSKQISSNRALDSQQIATQHEQSASLSELAERARGYAYRAKAPHTLHSYRADWQHFAAWCETQALLSLPASPTTVTLYLTELAERGRRIATLQRRLSAISQAHQAAGQESPTHHSQVRTVLAGIRRVHGAPPRAKAPLVTADLRALLQTLPQTLLGQRDHALLLLGFAGAFRRSELVSLDVADLTFTREGLVVFLRHSKTDQDGQGSRKGIPYGQRDETCPVHAVRQWLEAAGIVSGPLFRAVNRHGQVQAGRLSDKAVALVVKRAVAAAGLDPAQYAGHSLRAGLATAAAAAGVSERTIMAQTGHRSLPMVRRYIREGSLFRDNAAGSVGL